VASGHGFRFFCFQRLFLFAPFFHAFGVAGCTTARDVVVHQLIVITCIPTFRFLKVPIGEVPVIVTERFRSLNGIILGNFCVQLLSRFLCHSPPPFSV
jgi:hypothetical protein